jgi:hypothetical protein
VGEGMARGHAFTCSARIIQEIRSYPRLIFAIENADFGRSARIPRHPPPKLRH